MSEPLASGRNWKEDPDGNSLAQVGILSQTVWVRDDDQRSVRAVFKWCPTAAHRYSLAMERLIYVLGDHLGLPVPVTYLDDCGGQPGSAQLRVPGPAWKHAAASMPWMLDTVSNRDSWPLCVLFDLWIANPDRHDRNIILRPEPPDERPATADSCSTWLIDNANACLWPPQKFGAALKSVEDVPVTQSALMTPELEDEITKTMPGLFRAAYDSLTAEQREPLLDRITTFPENVIQEALAEVPDVYMSSTAKGLTAQLLLARRDQISILSCTAFPLSPGN